MEKNAIQNAGRQGLSGGWRAALRPVNDLPSFCPWKKVCEEQCTPVGLLNTPGRGEATLPLQEQEIPCDTNVLIHTHSARQVSYKNLLFFFFVFNHSTPKHDFIEDLFAASHHSCSP